MRYAICNETFEGWEHRRVCEYVAGLGYQGLEIAPFTLAGRVGDVTPEKRRELRRQAEDCGLTLLGLHWLLARTEGLQLTSPDAGVRQATADYLGQLARCCADLGGDILVFGSPAQRRIPAGAAKPQAVDYAVDTFRRARSAIGDAGVRLCLEPLAPPEADFINSCAEAVEILDRIDDPHFVLHLDVKAMSAEQTPICDLIRQYVGRTGHFHANDPNLRGPGFGAVDFRPIFKTLRESGYAGWVSVEVFDYAPDPETIARDSLRYMRDCDASRSAD